MAKQSYQGEALRVLFEPRRCIHARQCVLDLPQVFRAEERAWIEPDAAGAEAVMAQVAACPSGALAYDSHRDIAFKATGEPKEAAETEVLAARGGRLAIRPTRDGPFHVRGNVEIVCGSGRRVACHTEAWLCRCGASATKPYCDGSHARIGFTADGVDE